MGDLPRHVILDSPPELRSLVALVGSSHMPTVDWSMLFAALYDTIATRDIFYQEALYRLAAQMAHGDYLFETNTLSQLDRDMLEQLLCHAGHAVSRQLNQLKLYSMTGELLYQFREYKNDSTIIFNLSPAYGSPRRGRKPGD
jgi:hypothetical protein